MPEARTGTTARDEEHEERSGMDGLRRIENVVRDETTVPICILTKKQKQAARKQSIASSKRIHSNTMTDNRPKRITMPGMIYDVSARTQSATFDF
jgi:hypothetical protein